VKKTVIKRKAVTKILTGFRIHPEIKAIAIESASFENRSFSNYLENLIHRDLAGKNLLPAKKPVS